MFCWMFVQNLWNLFSISDTLEFSQYQYLLKFCCANVEFVDRCGPFFCFCFFFETRSFQTTRVHFPGTRSQHMFPGTSQTRKFHTSRLCSISVFTASICGRHEASRKSLSRASYGRIFFPLTCFSFSPSYVPNSKIHA